MKTLKKNITTLFLSVFLIISFVACDEGGNPDPGATAIADIAGDWVVEIERAGSHYAHDIISVYNTSDNEASEMWLDDLEHGWGLKTKITNLDLSALTFSGDNLDELYYDVTVTISNGVFIKNGTTAPSGTVTDSISFNAVFSDIPSETWHYYGYKRTGFLEDEP